MWWHTHRKVFVFRRNGRVHLNRRWASVPSTIGSRGVRISGSNAGYTMFRGSVKSTGYPLHPPVSPTLPLPCVTVCHHISTGLYFLFFVLYSFYRWNMLCFRSSGTLWRYYVTGLSNSIFWTSAVPSKKHDQTNPGARHFVIRAQVSVTIYTRVSTPTAQITVSKKRWVTNLANYTSVRGA
jgi:hypothetical protein